MTSTQTLLPPSTSAPWMAGEGEHLLKALGRLANAALALHAPGHAIRMVQAIRVLRPRESELLLLHATAMLAGGHPHEAADLVSQLDHPRARAIQSLCAALLNDPTSLSLAREAADSGDVQAVVLANVVLAGHGEARELPLPDATQAAAHPALH